MKPALLLALAAIIAGCTSDGSFDAAGFSKAAASVSDAYSSYQRTQAPVLIGHDAAGQPIYR